MIKRVFDNQIAVEMQTENKIDFSKTINNVQQFYSFFDKRLQCCLSERNCFSLNFLKCLHNNQLLLQFAILSRQR